MLLTRGLARMEWQCLSAPSFPCPRACPFSPSDPSCCDCDAWPKPVASVDDNWHSIDCLSHWSDCIPCTTTCCRSRAEYDKEVKQCANCGEIEDPPPKHAVCASSSHQDVSAAEPQVSDAVPCDGHAAVDATWVPRSWSPTRMHQ